MTNRKFGDFEELAEDCARGGVSEFFLASSPLCIPGAAASSTNAHLVK